MKKAVYLLLLVSGAAFGADDAALMKCRMTMDQAARLACYDAIPAGALPPVSHRAPIVAPVAAKTAEQNFGLEEVKKKKEVDSAPASIESSVVGTIQGWAPGTTFTLANGQVWRVVGGEASLSPMVNPKVKVVRNFFGTIFLEVEGTNHSPKVRRIQ